MKKSAICVLIGLWVCAVGAGELKWITDVPAAKKQAKKEKKIVLMDFTGSDWCGWCKKLDAEVFSTKEFAEYANKNLVLVELDFPSKKKQSAELKKANAALKQEYKVRGFPTIVALNSEGKVVWKQVGYLRGGPSAFIAKLEEARNK